VVKRALSWAAITGAAWALLSLASQVQLVAMSGGTGQAGHPQATGVDLAGLPLDPFEKSQGKLLVLIYVRTDCPISNRYAPTVEALGQKYAGQAVFMLVYPDKTETPQAIEKHLKEYGYPFAPVRDPQHELVKLGKVEITPEVAVFNAQRKLIYHGRIDNWYKDFGRARPAPTTHELDQALQAALTGGPTPASVGGVGCYISDLQ
jgi:thiol-disulfide isomerase/thioredoxin